MADSLWHVLKRCELEARVEEEGRDLRESALKLLPEFCDTPILRRLDRVAARIMDRLPA